MQPSTKNNLNPDTIAASLALATHISQSLAPKEAIDPSQTSQSTQKGIQWDASRQQSDIETIKKELEDKMEKGFASIRDAIQQVINEDGSKLENGQK